MNDFRKVLGVIKTQDKVENKAERQTINLYCERQVLFYTKSRD